MAHRPAWATPSKLQSMAEVLSSFHLPAGSVALGSVKSNIGHLKGAAGAAGLLKATLALRDKVLPPSVNCEHPNPDYRLCSLSPVCQYRVASVDGPSRYPAARRPQRLWLWRHQLPRCAGGVHSRQAQRKRQAVGSGHCTIASRGGAECQRGNCYAPAAQLAAVDLQSSIAWRAGDRRRLRSRDSPSVCKQSRKMPQRVAHRRLPLRRNPT